MDGIYLNAGQRDAVQDVPVLRGRQQDIRVAQACVCAVLPVRGLTGRRVARTRTIVAPALQHNNMTGML
jgi:hypothetical protein